ncbi:hypothetical protein Ddc_24346 [Ditylenchus destructor]|nr:hypothetical protein Ddc_24346 [Ditylenchus destructor]
MAQPAEDVGNHLGERTECWQESTLVLAVSGAIWRRCEVTHQRRIPGASKIHPGENLHYYCGNCCSVNRSRVRVVIKDDCFSRNPDELAHVCRENARSSQHAISNRKVLK